MRGLAPDADLAGIRRQLVLITGAVAVVVAAALVVIVQVVLEGTSSTAVQRVLQDRATALVGAADATSVDGSIAVPDERLDPGVAVYDESGLRVAGTVPPSLRESFESLSTTGSEQQVTSGEAYAVLARPFEVAGGAHGVVVLAEPLAPYENDEHAALLVSISAGALMVLLAVAMAAWTSRRALAPVQQMARTAAEWSEHDLERRFDLGPPTDEIRALAHTLDGLLEKVAATIRAEQRLTSELAHELRTPLTAIRGTADLVAMRPDLDDQLREDVADIQSACVRMAETMTVLLEVARSQPGADDTCTGEEIAASLTSHYGSRDDLAVHLPTVTVRAPLGLVVRALVPIVDNALRLAAHTTVTGQVESGTAEFHVADDGPGVPDQVLEGLFTPGVSTGSSGLGLALARRVARSVGGEVRYDPQHTGGAAFVVRFPAPGG